MSDIAINPVTRRVQFTGNTGTGPFAFTFNVLNSGDIEVYKNTTLLTLTSDYTVSIASNGTGSVTLQAGQAVVSVDYLTIIGGRDLERTTDFVTAGDLLASSLNEQLDSNVIMSQQLDESFGRSVSVSPGDVDVSMTLPVASSRASQVLAFTSTGAVTTTNLNDLPELTVDKLNVDNLTLDGNTISTTNTNGNLILTPNGTGDVVVSGDLVVNGTTTTIHSTVVDIADKNITIAYGSADAAAANGAGITVAGADATMNYYSTPDGWEFNKAVTVGYTGVTPQDLGGVLNVYSSSSSVPGMVIKSTASVDPKIQFEYLSQIWTVGQDSSSDDFKIINGTNLNSSAEIHINTDGDVALGGVSHYSNYELSVPQRVAIRSGLAVAGIDFASPTELVFDGNVGGTNGSFAKFRFVSSETDKMVLDGSTLKVNALAKLSGSEITISDNVVISGSITADSYNLLGVLSLADGSNSAPSLTNTGDTNTGLYFPAADEVGITAGGTQRLKVDSTGAQITGSLAVDTITNASSSTDVTIDTDFDILLDAGGGDIKFNHTDVYGSHSYNFDLSGGNMGLSGFHNFTITGTSNIRLNPGGGQVDFQRAGTTKGYIRVNTGDIAIYSGGSLNSTFTGANLAVAGTVTMDGGSTSADFTFGDNDKAIFGAGSDLQIYHDASNSYINENGTGSLFIKATNLVLQNSAGEYYFYGNSDGSAILYHNNENKLATTSTGIDVTGTVLADGLTVDQTSGYVRLQDLNTAVVSGTNMGGVEWRTGDSTVVGANRITAAIRAEGDGTFNATDKAPTKLVFSTHGTSGVDPVDRMTIDSSGNVGIGHASAPTSMLAVGGNTTSTIKPTVVVVDTTNGASISLRGQSPKIFMDSTAGGVPKILMDSKGIEFKDGTLDSEGSVAVKIDSSGNLLVGTTDSNPTSSAVNVAGQSFSTTGGVRSTVASNPAATFNRKTDDGEIALFRKDGATVGSIGTGSGLLTIGTGTGNLLFENALVAPCSTSALGASNGVVDLGAGTRRFKDLHLSGGVVFGDAGGSGTSTSNTLDDYEEGTFTPTLSLSTPGNSSFGYSTQLAHYVKVGDIVHFQLNIRLSAFTKGTGSGQVKCEGLPFTAHNTGGYASAGLVIRLYGWTFSDTPIASVNDNATSCALQVMSSNAGAENLADPDANAMIWLTGTYRAV